MKASAVLWLWLAALGGCASIVDGTDQTLAVKTMSGEYDIAGAQCTLTNNKGEWHVVTPGTVTIHRSYNDLNVRCAKDGFVPNVGSVPSGTRDIAFGNIFLGAVIGGAIDMGTGAAYDYPSPIIMQLQLVPIPVFPAVPAY